MAMAIPTRRKKPRIINRWYLTFYLRNHRFWFLVLALGAIGYAFFNGLSGIWADIGKLALPLLVGSVLLWAGSLIRRIQKMKQALSKSQQTVLPIEADEFESFMRKVELPTELQQAGYSIVEGGVARDLYKHHAFAGFSATSKQLNTALRQRSGTGSTPCQVDVPVHARSFGNMAIGAWAVRSLAARFGWHWALVRRWRLPLISREIMPTVIKELPAYSAGKLANEMKIRLAADLLPPPASDNWPVQLQRTDYLSDLVTGHITGIKVRDKSGNDIFDGFVNAYKWSGGRPLLKLMAQSGCSNQVGVSGMALGVSEFKTESGAMQLHGPLYFVGQSMHNLASPGLLAPSGSGSLDWTDVSDGRDDFIGFGMWREMLEETWAGDWRSLTERGHLGTVITGYARMLHRGGKPEFYGLMVMPRDENEHDIDESETPFAAESMAERVYPLTAARLIEVQRQFMQLRRAKLSHPLFMCLTLLIDYLADEPEHFAALVENSARYVRGKRAAA